MFLQFAKYALRRMNTSFILITHNSDYARPDSLRSKRLLKDERLIRWFVNNPTIFHEKLEPIPIGLMNIWFNKSGVLEWLEPHIQ